MEHTDLTSAADSSVRQKKVLALLVSVAIVIAAITFGLLYWRQAANNPLSEDATLEASVVHITSSVPGKITDLYVKEGDLVKKGQLLFAVDPEFYELRLQQAQAELELAQAVLASKERLIKAESHNASVSTEQIERARTNLALAQQSQARMASLAPKGYVTQQQLDQARTLTQDATISLRQATEQAEAASALVSNTQAETAMVDMRRSGLAMAERDKRQTLISAPHDGYVVGLTVGVGEYLLPQESIFTLVDAGHWHAVGMYRETDLQRIVPGNCATVYVLADPNTAIKGRVDSIGWGVSSADMINLPRAMPYIQKSMNWVRVAQRFPVRISLEFAPEQAWLLRMGASATTIVHYGEQCD